MSQVKGQHPVAGELAPSPEPRQQETVPLLNGEGYPGAGSWCWAPQKNRVQREPPVQRTRSLGAAGAGGRHGERTPDGGAGRIFEVR